MRDENYYREKQNKPLPTVQKIHESHVKKERAIGMIREFFRYAFTGKVGDGIMRGGTNYVPHEVPTQIHKRTMKERLIRRYKHACRMRNVA
jgi:hypothetical protein